MLIQLNNVCKTYNEGKINEVKALKDINFSIEKSEFIAITGPSGSGKSTLLKIIGCMMKPTCGEYLFDGEAINSMTEAALAKKRNEDIGFVFQNFQLLEDRTVEENVMLPLLFSKTRFKDIARKTYIALEKINMTEFAKRKTSELSGGQAQRIAIARAMINNPKLILADEPTGALDSHTAQEVVDIFRSLNNAGTTVVVVTHNHAVAKGCDKAYVLEDGRLEF